MKSLADLHIHSRFAYATSKDITVENIAKYAQIKGIDIVGTGDFTHPAWQKDLIEDLIEDNDTGLYKYKFNKNYKTLFCPQTEISSIYKKNGKTRKIHNIILLPTLEDAKKLSNKLSKLGNVISDGRPILGIDCKELLSITLDICDTALFIPAHIWTPHFALLGEKSGFDTIEECFEDLTDYIFALETGLSSDPAMNRLLSMLDNYALISNSDAHSCQNLGREANVFEGNITYKNIYNSIVLTSKREPQLNDCKFLGTIEMYPEEGKYHLDGHKKCNIVLSPEEADKCNNICPICKKPLTRGVLHRVINLADRKSQPVLLNEPNYSSIIPLKELISEIMGISVNSIKVKNKYEEVINNLGSELEILVYTPINDITHIWDKLGEAISLMRNKDVFLIGGYDGEYGKAKVFYNKDN